jgi:hypothetical protein
MLTPYKIHPIAACYPRLPESECEALKQQIRIHGLQKDIILYDGQILDCYDHARACLELGITPRYTTPEIRDPVEYVIAQNELRRHLTRSQKAVVGEQLARLKPDSPQVTQQIATRLGVGPSTIQKVRYLRINGFGELLLAIAEGRIGVDAARQIAHLEKNNQPAARQSALTGTKDTSPAEPTTDDEQVNEWKAKIEAHRVALSRPDSFPLDAKIPTGESSDEKWVREAIEILRTNQRRIPNLGKFQLDELIHPYTQRIQAYHLNRHNHPRPEGELDPRIVAWVKDVAERMLHQQRIKALELQIKKHHQSKKRVKQPRKIIPLFDAMFRQYWVQEKKLLRYIPVSEFATFRERWLAETAQFFREKAEALNAKGTDSRKTRAS